LTVEKTKGDAEELLAPSVRGSPFENPQSAYEDRDDGEVK